MIVLLVLPMLFVWFFFGALWCSAVSALITTPIALFQNILFANVEPFHASGSAPLPSMMQWLAATPWTALAVVSWLILAASFGLLWLGVDNRLITGFVRGART
ncbi:hypothetical protein [Burkholderia cenocepacia]|uniref:hypothetical protein n=1 Tax=Burkholderia cenocepacia TaxID=95486 RepID=UPI000F567BEB|nr:hypothetical protein [Burkholderia cenocepacia]RQU97773.1 hypothetical protein DF042_27015 [Burkholderia cenocepacia]